MQTLAIPKRIAVTGHRPDKLGGYDPNNPIALAVKRHMKDLLSKPENDLAITISGMALGVDQWWAEVSIELDIPFVAAIPFEGFHTNWPKESQERFHNILEKAYSIVYVSDPGYKIWKMQIRNEWMVDHATHLIAYWDGSKGGTANCVRYANWKRANIEVFNPRMIS